MSVFEVLSIMVLVSAMIVAVGIKMAFSANQKPKRFVMRSNKVSVLKLPDFFYRKSKYSDKPVG